MSLGVDLSSYHAGSKMLNSPRRPWREQSLDVQQEAANHCKFEQTPIAGRRCDLVVILDANLAAAWLMSRLGVPISSWLGSSLQSWQKGNRRIAMQIMQCQPLEIWNKTTGYQRCVGQCGSGACNSAAWQWRAWCAQVWRPTPLQDMFFKQDGWAIWGILGGLLRITRVISLLKLKASRADRSWLLPGFYRAALWWCAECIRPALFCHTVLLMEPVNISRVWPVLARTCNKSFWRTCCQFRNKMLSYFRLTIFCWSASGTYGGK